MFSSETSISFSLSNQSTLKNNNNNISAAAVEDFSKGVEINGSDFFQNHHQGGSGLSRYRSAPSSFLAALLDPNTTDNSSSGDDDESDAFFSALIEKSSDNHHHHQYTEKEGIGAETAARPGFLNWQTGGYVGSYSLGMESQVQVMMSDGNGDKDGNCSNLVRQSSLPAGFFNGFGIMGEAGNYRVHNHAEASSSAAHFKNHQINFSSSPPSTSRFMPTIPENGNDNISTSTHENGQSNNCNNNSFWNESPFNALKRNRDVDLKMFSSFNGLDSQSGENRKTSTGLVSHLSLPKTSSEMAVVENYLHFQQETTVPCQVRAKRGCATHPRSIAERMRRTRISDNIKKLQDLFPNMDKQTNTADMLDLAVEYIKDLQKQVQTLNDTRAKCVCSKLNRQTSPTT